MSFDDAIAEFPAAHRNTRPPNVPYSFWHLLEHRAVMERLGMQYERDVTCRVWSPAFTASRMRRRLRSTPYRGRPTSQDVADLRPILGDGLVAAALSMAAGHIRSCITGRVGNVRATSENPAATNIAMVPV